MLATGSPQPTVPIPSTAAPYMVWGWKPSVALQYQSATGNDIKTKVLNLIREFQAMKHDTKEQMVNAFMSAGIWGVGLTGLKAAWRAFRAASVITEAVEAEAIADGIFHFFYLFTSLFIFRSSKFSDFEDRQDGRKQISVPFMVYHLAI